VISPVPENVWAGTGSGSPGYSTVTVSELLLPLYPAGSVTVTVMAPVIAVPPGGKSATVPSLATALIQVPPESALTV
jgi:hypothetical protein